ncbi:alpha/beta-hydrolase [Zalerion maritima]|uniref:Alpha/beta-hydrolase n=1 Tax=Zalerion maritima TaxID=339359 RepID=A0AAD5WT16_9PEZI|nr:alpha/beta-hydrolase [Zalerion maritima]
MIDHVLGRPSVKSRRLQVLAVLSFWSFYLFRGHKHGPPFIRLFSRFATKALTTWQTVLITLMYLYTARNFSSLIGIASPEPMSGMYTPSYYRATWVLTALDAGFWTAMKIKTKWLRDFASIIFTAFYLVAAEQADEKVRKVRGTVTVEHLRVSWNKGTTPYVAFFQNLVRPRFMKWPPREMRIKRPSSSDYSEDIHAWLYWDGTIEELKICNKIILDIPGGGFVAMNPRTNDDKLLCWAARTRIPVVSIDYKKAPEYPYPCALNECYDIYASIVRSKGKCIGLSGDVVPHVIVTGDSAGGNLAAAMTLMVIESGSTPSRRFTGQAYLPPPIGLILFYPALDMNIGNWMSDEQMALIQDRRDRVANRDIMRSKSAQYTELAGTPARESPDEVGGGTSRLSSPDSDGDASTALQLSQTTSPNPDLPLPEYSHATTSAAALAKTTDTSATATATGTTTTGASHRPAHLKTRLATSSMISYFNDRVLTPELMRAMIVLYIGPHNRPDFATDYLLSPILAPDTLLEQFPKTIFLTGECDPLVDDTVIFAGRLRRVKREAHRRKRYQSSRSLHLEALRTDGFSDDEFDVKDFVEVILLPGISHGFLQFPTVFPDAWGLFDRASQWMIDLFRDEEIRERDEERAMQRAGEKGAAERQQRESRERDGTASGTDDDGIFLTMGGSRAQKKAAARKAHSQATSFGSGTRENGQTTTEIEAGTGTGTGKEIAESWVIPDDQYAEKKKEAKQRKKSRVEHTANDLGRLRSSEDLLGRRMQGIAGGLTRLMENDDEYGE